MWATGVKGGVRASRRRARVPILEERMEIVELLPGVFVRYELYCRVRTLLVLLLLVLLIAWADRAGLRAELAPELPSELLAHRPLSAPAPARDPDADAAFQLTYLERFLRGRAQPLDLLRYVTTVLPPTVRVNRVTVIAEDTITGQARGGPTLRVEGRAPDPERLRSLEDNLRVMAPQLSLARFSQTADAEGGYQFLLSTEAPTREGGGR
jgi:hypothetical protein